MKPTTKKNFRRFRATPKPRIFTKEELDSSKVKGNIDIRPATFLMRCASSDDIRLYR